ncbi:hypothetical protein Tco_0662062 [Tanacetum coccineum]
MDVLQCDATRTAVDSYLPVVSASSYAYMSFLKHFLPIMNLGVLLDYPLIAKDMAPAQMTSASTHAADAASSSQLGRLIAVDGWMGRNADIKDGVSVK